MSGEDELSSSPSLPQRDEHERATRRAFLRSAGVTAGALAIGAKPACGRAQDDGAVQTDMQPAQALNDIAPSGLTNDRITQKTLAEAEKLAGVEFTRDERRQMMRTLQEQIERIEARVAQFVPANDLAPATIFDPRLPGFGYEPFARESRLSDPPVGAPPSEPVDVAYAAVRELSHWLRTRELRSVDLTQLCLDRLREHGTTLACVITLTEELALAQAAQADAELDAGKWRGPLHGIPWGAKDLLDTAGIATTWGATPYRERVPEQDAEVVRRLSDSGAVLVAKLSLGALAYNDTWFGGQTRNPWNVGQGSSGSSAGPAAAVAAGLVPFAIGSETYGSIVSPCMRCGATGLRPTFGRVSRGGAMALCWTLDKLGPIARTVEDCAIVLQAINGGDPLDPSSIDMPFAFDAHLSLQNLRVGFDPAWFEHEGAEDLDRAALDVLREQGAQLIEIEVPAWKYDLLMPMLYAEAAAAFEEITLQNLDDLLRWQEDQAWPNTLRQTRFLPAIEVVQADRFRRQVMEMMAAQFAEIDLMISPSFADPLLLVTNFTGQPSLTLRTGLLDAQTPHGITLWGGLFNEAALVRAGLGLERAFSVWRERPPLFA